MELSIETFLEEECKTDRKVVQERVKQVSLRAKQLEKCFQTGNMDGIVTAVTQVTEVNQLIAQSAADIKRKLDNFDLPSYMQNNFQKDLYTTCQKEGVNIQGTFPRYEVFPFYVEINTIEKYALINGKKIKSMRPSTLSKTIKVEKDFLEKASFNADSFLQGIYSCYQLLVAKLRIDTGASTDISISLKDIYSTLTGLPAFRKAYTVNMFSFDLHRLLRAGHLEISGYMMELGSVRQRANALRILDEKGREQFYGRIQFRSKLSGIND